MAHYTHALTWAKSVGDREVVAEAEYGLGLLATLAGDLDQADALFTQSLVVYREIGLAYVSRATYVSGYVALVRGQAERAIILFEEGLRRALDTFLVEVAAYTLIGLAVIDARAGRVAQAAA